MSRQRRLINKYNNLFKIFNYNIAEEFVSLIFNSGYSKVKTNRNLRDSLNTNNINVSKFILIFRPEKYAMLF